MRLNFPIVHVDDVPKTHPNIRWYRNDCVQSRAVVLVPQNVWEQIERLIESTEEIRMADFYDEEDPVGLILCQYREELRKLLEQS